MKKFTLKSKFKLLTLTFLIMIFIANPIISFGADNLPEYLQVSIDKTEVNMGDVVRLKLSNLSTEQIDGFGDDRGVRYLSAKISYNKDVFELNEDGIEEALLDDIPEEGKDKYGWKLHGFSPETGELYFAFMYPLYGMLMGSCDIATITLKVKDNIATTQEKITFTDVTIGTDDYNEAKVADISLDVLVNGNTLEDDKQEDNNNSEQNNTSNNNSENNNINTNNIIKANTINTEKDDATVANKVLPKAGNTFLTIIMSICIALSIFLIINYKKYQKFKKV